MEQTSGASRPTEISDFSLKEFFTQCLSRWRWFLLSIVVFCAIGYFYGKRQAPVYSRTMDILIKEDGKGGSSSADLGSAFSSLGLFSSKTNVNNELISLTSPAVMYEVVKRLDLDMNYSQPGGFYAKTLFGSSLPYTVRFLDLEEQQGGAMMMEIGDNGSLTFSKFVKNTEDGVQKIKEAVKGKVGAEVRTPLGRVLVSANPAYVAPKKKDGAVKKMVVSRSGMQSTVEKYSARLKGDLADKNADVIELSIKDVNTQRAVAILDAVVDVYRENWREDKNKVSIATSKFITERLAKIESQLSGVDSDISEYKSEHMVPDLEEAAKLSMKQAVEMSNSQLELTNKMTMAVYLKDYLSNPANDMKVIPVNTGIGSPQLELQISNYNNLLLSRNTLADNSSEKNPLVIDYDAQLKGLHQAIYEAVAGQVAALNTSLKNLEGAKGTAKGQLTSGPTQALHLLSLERDQKVMQSLYIYLLQKREENEISQTYNADKVRIITPPTGSLRPVSPKKGMIMMISFLLGLCIPGAALYMAEASNTKVRSRKDLEKMSTPFAGEIPYVGKRGSKIKKALASLTKNKKGGRKKLETVDMVVKEGSRDALSESIRIVRGNIDFMLHKDKTCNVIMVTSFNPGSGKSFISFNLSASFALKGKRVLVIDGDLRHGSVSQFVGMPSKGISNYLTGNTDDWKGLVKAVPGQEGMYVLPIGHRPPNPAELLDNDRLGVLLDEARKEYDYVLVDCPPVDVVVDTQIVERYVDRTIFIVRAGLLEKHAVAEIDELYHNKRFKQMSIVLNATDSRHSRSHSYGTSGYYGN